MSLMEDLPGQRIFRYKTKDIKKGDIMIEEQTKLTVEGANYEAIRREREKINDKKWYCPNGCDIDHVVLYKNIVSKTQVPVDFHVHSEIYYNKEVSQIL